MNPMPIMLLASGMDLSIEGSLLSFDGMSALLALTAMEIILGIDNIVFIAILTGRLPESQRSMARYTGLIVAMGMRILLLLCITWLMGLVEPLIRLSDFVPTIGLAERLAEDPEVNEVSGRDLILLCGGLFLLHTAVREIHHKIEGGEEESELGNLPGDEGGAADGITPVDPARAPMGLAGVLFRIAVMDIIFSLDSVITAVGMTQVIPIMVLAVMLSVGVMIVFANRISDFVQKHPTVKMLALSFLMLIGVVLVSDGIGKPISKGYIYFAMAFSLLVEFFNLRMRFKRVRPSKGEGETGSLDRSREPQPQQ